MAVLDKRASSAFSVRKAEQMQKSSYSLPVQMQVAFCSLKALPLAMKEQSGVYLIS